MLFYGSSKTHCGKTLPLELSLVELYNKANIPLSFIEYELNCLYGASHLVDYVSGYIRFDLENVFYLGQRNS